MPDAQPRQGRLQDHRPLGRPQEGLRQAVHRRCRGQHHPVHHPGQLPPGQAPPQQRAKANPRCVDWPVSARPELTPVTGGAGFVGSHLVDRLMLLGHEVTVLDNFFTGSRTTVGAPRRATWQDALTCRCPTGSVTPTLRWSDTMLLSHSSLRLTVSLHPK